MKCFEVSKNLPFYWRLREEQEAEFETTNAPFTFELNSSGHLVQKRIDGTLSLLEKIYRFPANIGYFQEGYGFAEKYLDDVINFLERILKSEKVQGKFLEIGCGGMMILDYFKRKGFEVLGVDPSPLSANASRTKDIPLINNFLTDEIEVRNVQFIFHYDVLEHVENASEFLQIQFDLLTGNGLLVFSVPNPEPSMEIGDISPAMHQHLNYFSRNSIMGLLREVGFVDVNCEVAKYGGSLYVTARKGFPKLKTSLISSNHDKEYKFFDYVTKAQDNFKERLYPKVKEFEELGLYVPLRALPYLESIEEVSKNLSLRLIDDTGAWNGKYFDGVDQPVENFIQYCQSPAPLTIVFSLTFEREIVEKVHRAGLEVISLRNLLQI